MSQNNVSDGDLEQPFMSHLVELRQRLVRMVFAVLGIFIVAFPFANDIYTYLAAPLMRHLPAGASMIATDVASPFLTPFKLSLVLSIFVAMPYILYQLWGFIAPGLYRNERKLVLPLVASSTILYYLGMTFAYFVVFPLIFGFFVSVAPEGVTVMTDISKYLDFVLKLFFAFGLAFEVPVATVLLVLSGLTTPDALVEKRPYIIVGVFVMAMLLTPPDVISQTMLALPVWFLFEVGIIASRMVTKDRIDEYADNGPDSDGPSNPPNPPDPSGPAGPSGGSPSGSGAPPGGYPGAAAAAATGLAAIEAEAALNAAAQARTVADNDGLQAHQDDDENDDDDWDEGDDELDRAIAEVEALDADDDDQESDPPVDWEHNPARYTDEGFDEELDLQDGGVEDTVPEPELAEADDAEPAGGMESAEVEPDGIEQGPVPVAEPGSDSGAEQVADDSVRGGAKSGKPAPA
jgi:sec-independent protein translocase protein TatC